MAGKAPTRSSLRAQRRAREIAGTRQYIVDAAVRAFARVGYHQAKMEDIAAEAGYTTPSLYSYFSGKEEIVEEMSRQLFADFTTTVDLPLPLGLALAEKLRVLLGRQLEYADRRRDALLLFVTIGAEGASSRSGEPARRGDFLRYLERLIAWFAAEGRGLGGHDPEELALLYNGIVQSFFMRWLLAGAGTKLSDAKDRIVELFLYGAAGRASDANKKRARRRT